MIYVVPTILVPKQSDFKDRVAAIMPHYTRAQIDVLNSTFVHAESFGDAAVIETFISRLICEVDLMVAMDGYDLDQWNKAWVDKIIFHVEATRQPKKIIEKIKSWDKKVFLSLNPDTEVTELDPYLDIIDGVLFMTVIPGRSGNPFQAQVLDTIKKFRDQHETIEIEVDGGVSNETLPALLAVGINGCAVGSYLNNKVIEGNTQRLLSIIEQHDSQKSSR